MKKKSANKTVKKMIQLFKKMKPYENVNVYVLYRRAVELIPNPELDDMAFYWDFHEERIKQKIKIKRTSHYEKGECVGLPMNVDWFYRLPSDEDIDAEYKIVREKYHKKYGYYPDEIHICDMMLRSKPALLRAMKNSLKRGTPLRTNETHVNAWNRDIPDFDDEI